MQFIKDEKLANGLTLTFSDCSKPMAADRWLVKMEGEVKFPLGDVVWPDADGDDPQLLEMVKSRMGDSISYVLCKERIFIDDSEKEAVLSDLVDQVESNLLGYLGDPSFTQKLFVRRYDEMRQQCLLERQLPQPPVNDEDDSPADFSACFRD